MNSVLIPPVLCFVLCVRCLWFCALIQACRTQRHDESVNFALISPLLCFVLFGCEIVPLAGWVLFTERRDESLCLKHCCVLFWLVVKLCRWLGGCALDRAVR